MLPRALCGKEQLAEKLKMRADNGSENPLSLSGQATQTQASQRFTLGEVFATHIDISW